MNRVKEARFRKGKTQIQLFKLTGIWPSRISYIENGYIEANEAEKIMLSQVLQTKKDWLFPPEKTR